MEGYPEVKSLNIQPRLRPRKGNIYRVVSEIEADSLTDAWAISAKGHPRSFRPGEDWGEHRSFTIQEISREITMTTEKENN